MTDAEWDKIKDQIATCGASHQAEAFAEFVVEATFYRERLKREDRINEKMRATLERFADPQNWSSVSHSPGHGMGTVKHWGWGGLWGTKEKPFELAQQAMYIHSDQYGKGTPSMSKKEWQAHLSQLAADVETCKVCGAVSGHFRPDSGRCRKCESEHESR